MCTGYLLGALRSVVLRVFSVFAKLFVLATRKTSENRGSGLGDFGLRHQQEEHLGRLELSHSYKLTFLWCLTLTFGTSRRWQNSAIVQFRHNLHTREYQEVKRKACIHLTLGSSGGRHLSKPRAGVVHPAVGLTQRVRTLFTGVFSLACDFVHQTWRLLSTVLLLSLSLWRGVQSFWGSRVGVRWDTLN